ncbi:MAG: ABC transporter permease [Actinomycetota bacterium]
MTAATTAARRVPRGAFRQLVLTEARLTLREPIALVWGVAMPVILVVVFGLIPAFQEPIPGYGTMTIFHAYAPILVLVSLSMLGLVGLPAALASYRELGVLRRMSTTPVPPSRLLAAQLVVNLASALLAIALIAGIGTLAFDLPLPQHWPGFVLTLALATACLFAIGLSVAAVARTGRAAAAIGNALFFPLAFFAGLWFPQQAMPSTLATISRLAPTGAAVEAFNATMAGDFPATQPLLLLVGYTAVFAVIAVRAFRWE